MAYEHTLPSNEELSNQLGVQVTVDESGNVTFNRKFKTVMAAEQILSAVNSHPEKNTLKKSGTEIFKVGDVYEVKFRNAANILDSGDIKDYAKGFKTSVAAAHKLDKIFDDTERAKDLGALNKLAEAGLKMVPLTRDKHDYISQGTFNPTEYTKLGIFNMTELGGTIVRYRDNKIEISNLNEVDEGKFNRTLAQIQKSGELTAVVFAQPATSTAPEKDSAVLVKTDSTPAAPATKKQEVKDAPLTQVEASASAAITDSVKKNFIKAVVENNYSAADSIYKEADKEQKALLANLRHTDGAPLLHHAVQNNNADMVKLLISMDANVNAKNTASQSTALHWAAYHGNLKIVDFLISKGADINALNSHGQTPEAVAIERNISPDVIDKLKALKAYKESFSGYQASSSSPPAAAAAEKPKTTDAAKPNEDKPKDKKSDSALVGSDSENKENPAAAGNENPAGEEKPKDEPWYKTMFTGKGSGMLFGVIGAIAGLIITGGGGTSALIIAGIMALVAGFVGPQIAEKLTGADKFLNEDQICNIKALDVTGKNNSADQALQKSELDKIAAKDDKPNSISDKDIQDAITGTDSNATARLKKFLAEQKGASLDKDGNVDISNIGDLKIPLAMFDKMKKEEVAAGK